MKETNNLKSDLIQLEADSSKLEKKVKAVDDDLIYVHDTLSISETLHDRLSTLDSNLKLASDLLGVARIIPPISAAASNTKRAIDLFREPVSKAKKASGDVDKRVKPIRTKVHEVQQEVAKLDNELKEIIGNEQALIQSVRSALRACLQAP
jgi:chromosome segregation ATPase